MQRIGEISTPRSHHMMKLCTDSPCLKIPPSPFMKHLGFGTGVDVYLVQRSPKHGQYRSPWAIKKINKKLHGDKTTYAKRLRDEAMILKELSHVNIVGFRGFTESQGNYLLAMEDGQKSLMSMIEERADKRIGPFPAQAILQTASCVADALFYLHHDKHLLHGDLKSANILVLGNFELVKICDFGVSLPLDVNLTLSDSNATYVGTRAWSCKEVLNEGVVTNKADIYSYGLTLYEMLSLSIPHMHVFPDEENFERSEDFERAFEAAEDDFEDSLGTRPPLAEYDYDASYTECIELFWTCTDELPQGRPSAQQLVQYLSTFNFGGITMPDPTCRLEF